MTLDEMLDMLGDECCKFCKYDDECQHGVVCYGGQPIEPPCCSMKDKELFNEDEIREYFIKEGLIMPNFKGIWFNESKGITVVKWEDDSITKVTVQHDETFDQEKGIALCFMKKYCGNTGKYNDILKRYLEK